MDKSNKMSIFKVYTEESKTEFKISNYKPVKCHHRKVYGIIVPCVGEGYGLINQGVVANDKYIEEIILDQVLKD